MNILINYDAPNNQLIPNKLLELLGTINCLVFLYKIVLYSKIVIMTGLDMNQPYICVLMMSIRKSGSAIPNDQLKQKDTVIVPN